MDRILSKNIYSITAIQKSIYEMASDVVISISEDNLNYIVDFKPVNSELVEELWRNFNLKCNDYTIRESLSNKTGALRNLILAHAYSKTQFIK